MSKPENTECTSQSAANPHPGLPVCKIEVNVAVLPPVPVDDWTLDTLSDRIAGVRQRYLDTLADWPTEA